MKYEAGNTKQEIQSRKYKAENTKQKIQFVRQKPRAGRRQGAGAAQKIVRMTFVQWRGDSFMRLIGMPCTME